MELARPKQLNALASEFWANFEPAVQALSACDTVRCILLCAQGSTFCAGIDIGLSDMSDIRVV